MLPTWFETVVESEVLNAIFFVLPAMFANVTPMIFGGGVPIDFRGNCIDNKRILGNSKTIRGFIAGCLGGFVMGILTTWWFNEIVDAGFTLHLANGFFQGFGAVIGDMVGSFIKRRRNIQSGGSLMIVDQTGFMFFGLLFGMIGVKPLFPWTYWIVMIPLAGIVHFAANAVAYTLGWKDVWW
ncbi:MAG TPA: CDP-2,3-bis-(O-geranylgeranyl)-sn-glycerol synthase [candidate division Zixibacteria bacterium]|nr:CDP-2,3-bis-(O-geranylgeranyl)-sn-glycerol synthase [candidate division Zixibacteria bacterium]